MLTDRLDDYITDTIDNFTVSHGRIDMMEKIATTLFKVLKTDGELNVVFVCTHNSRRSHMAQVMFAAMVEHLEIANTNTFSAGTEVTEVYPSTLTAFKNLGFEVEKSKDSHKITSGDLSLDLFSKTYQDESIKSPYVAVMVCDQADKSCPVLPEAKKRFTLTYNDPKSSDGTDKEEEIYASTLDKIAQEMALLSLLLDEKLES